MDITKEITGDLTAEIKIHLLAEDYRGEVNKEINKFAREARMPGFRPGKVPKGLVKRMMGKSVVIEQVSRLVGTELNQYIENEQLKILGEPIPTEKRDEDYFDLDCKKDLDFTFEVGLAPEFELALDAGGDPLNLYEVEVDDEFLNKEIEANQERYSEVENPEKAEEGDILFGELAEETKDEDAEEEGFKKMIVLNPSRIEKPDFFKPFLDQEIEFKTELDIFSMADEAQEIAQLLMVEEEDLEALKEKKLSFTIKKINRTKAAELNEEFFGKVLSAFGQRVEEEEAVTEEYFRSSLKEKISEELSGSVSNFFQNQARDLLLEANPIQLPEEFLRKWMQEADKQENPDPEKIENDLKELKESLHWSLIMDKLQEGHPELEVSREELEESILERVRMHSPDATPEMEQEFLNYSLQNQEIMRMHLNRLVGDRLYKVLQEELNPTPTSISATDFVDMVNKDREEQQAQG